jgi:hypothetical protein
MSTYLLLRDNKQSGPYTLGEITAKGFKKYDLVWVENKSAAWRYPGEITELKSFAPIIEEQPFDRFFKRPSEEMQSKNIPQLSIVKAEIAESAVLPRVIFEINDKKVYASLPPRKTSTTSVHETIGEQVAKEKINSGEPKPALIDYTHTDKSIQAESQFTHDQFKVSRLPSKKRNPLIRYMQPATLVACVLALLGAGIFIGLSISKGNPTLASKTDANDKQTASVNKPESQAVLIPVSSPASSPATDEKPIKIASETKKDDIAINPISPEQEKTLSTAAERKKSIPSKTNTALSSQKHEVRQEAKNDTTYYATVPHRVATHRADAVGEKYLVKNNIANLVSVSSNKYHVGTFGGISEVQLTVSNKSIYPLDLVTVEVQYIQANKKIFKTENVYFRNIRPGEAMMIEAPESPRGIKVQYKVSVINSKELSISYSGT